MNRVRNSILIPIFIATTLVTGAARATSAHHRPEKLKSTASAAGEVPTVVRQKAEQLGFTGPMFEIENHSSDLIVYKIHQDVRSPKQMPTVYIWYHPPSKRMAVEY